MQGWEAHFFSNKVPFAPSKNRWMPDIFLQKQPLLAPKAGLFFKNKYLFLENKPFFLKKRYFFFRKKAIFFLTISFFFLTISFFLKKRLFLEKQRLFLQEKIFILEESHLCSWRKNCLSTGKTDFWPKIIFAPWFAT